MMDTREYFNYVVVPNYNEFVRRPTDFHLLWNALVSMNTVAEHLGLYQRGYGQVSRNELYREAQEIRGQLSGVEDLKFCADTLKHVRKIQDQGGGKFTTIATSTGVDPTDPTTWKVGGHDLGKVAHDVFATLDNLPELKPAP
jgi:hypothetical protein